MRILGGVLPGELSERIMAQDVAGISPADYHLAGESVRAAASRAWAYLLPTYQRFRAELATLPEDSAATSLTRDAWLLPLMGQLGYGRVPLTPGGHLAAGEGDEQREYPISHLWTDVPMHLLGWNLDLDSRAKGVRGAARAPQSMVQEYLNREHEHLWAVLSNGRLLRLLRDSTALVGQAYVEFDLEIMFDTEQFSDFVLLFAVCHESRLARFPGDGDDDGGGQGGFQCGAVTDRWIERWRTDAIAFGTRAMASLRGQVEKALEVLGTGYLAHPANHQLRERLHNGEITPADYQRALLRLVYRLLFWMVAEDRSVLLAPDATAQSRARYDKYFSSRRLRALARTRVGTRHHDLGAQLDLVFAGLGENRGLPELGLPGLGGIFEPTEIDVVTGQVIANHAVLEAIRLLSTTRDSGGHTLRVVDFRHLGAEELGGIYEGLLELHPRIDPAERKFTLAAGAGNERKKTGSYYTPASLINLVLDTALDPLLDRATATGTTADQEQALLALRVCDPACGSGHFLVAAARRIANRLARLRSVETEPSQTQAQAALADVIAACIYGVDLNPMAAELAKVSLWLEAIAPGRPLGFLDAHIKVGNSLLGTTPALLAAGIPDGAFTAITGDDKKLATGWKNHNRKARDQANQVTLLEHNVAVFANLDLGAAARSINAAPALSLDDVALARRRYQQLRDSPELRRLKLAADAWTAAFFQPKLPTNTVPITTDTVRALERTDNPAPEVVAAVNGYATAHRYFHWHLEFPDIFIVPDEPAADTDPDTGWHGGFDAVIGNPPWETVQMTEKEFFAESDPEIANAATAAARKKLISALGTDNPGLAASFTAALRTSESTNVFVRGSGRYPLSARGKTNTYAIFAETFRTVINPGGRAGILAPTGLATDATTAPFFSDTLRSRRLAAFFDFENRQPLFEGVDSRFRFAAVTFTGRHGSAGDVPLAFMLHDPVDAPSRSFTLSPAEILALNPNTGTLPVFASRRDADITLGIYRRHPVLIRDADPNGNPWGLSFKQGLFNMSSDSHLFRTAADLEALGATFDGWAWTHTDPDGHAKRWLPLYEAKLLSHYDHRFATYHGAQGQSLPRITEAQHDDPTIEPQARYWVFQVDIDRELESKPWPRIWTAVWRGIARTTDVRTCIASISPTRVGGGNFDMFRGNDGSSDSVLLAVMNSLGFDFVVRQKLSNMHFQFSVMKQLPAPIPATFANRPPWSDEPLRDFVTPRVLELTYTSYRIAPYARDLGDTGEPFRWNPERRALLQSELDAAMMHVYGLQRDEVEHILDSFPVLRRYEERPREKGGHGEFRTARLVLTYYDQMAKAAETDTPYETTIDPPPGSGPRHPARHS